VSHHLESAFLLGIVDSGQSS